MRVIRNENPSETPSITGYSSHTWNSEARSLSVVKQPARHRRLRLFELLAIHLSSLSFEDTEQFAPYAAAVGGGALAFC